MRKSSDINEFNVMMNQAQSNAGYQIVNRINFDQLERKKGFKSMFDSRTSSEDCDQIIDIKRPVSQTSTQRRNSFSNSECELSEDEDTMLKNTRNNSPLDSSRWKSPGLAFESPPHSPKKKFIPVSYLQQFRT